MDSREGSKEGPRSGSASKLSFVLPIPFYEKIKNIFSKEETWNYWFSLYVSLLFWWNIFVVMLFKYQREWHKDLDNMMTKYYLDILSPLLLYPVAGVLLFMMVCLTYLERTGINLLNCMTRNLFKSNWPMKDHLPTHYSARDADRPAMERVNLGDLVALIFVPEFPILRRFIDLKRFRFLITQRAAWALVAVLFALQVYESNSVWRKDGHRVAPSLREEILANEVVMLLAVLAAASVWGGFLNAIAHVLGRKRVDERYHAEHHLIPCAEDDFFPLVGNNCLSTIKGIGDCFGRLFECIKNNLYVRNVDSYNENDSDGPHDRQPLLGSGAPVNGVSGRGFGES